MHSENKTIFDLKSRKVTLKSTQVEVKGSLTKNCSSRSTTKWNNFVTIQPCEWGIDCCWAWSMALLAWWLTGRDVTLHHAWSAPGWPGGNQTFTREKLAPGSCRWSDIGRNDRVCNHRSGINRAGDAMHYQCHCEPVACPLNLHCTAQASCQMPLDFNLLCLPDSTVNT